MVKGRDLLRLEEALVDDGARGKARNVEALRVRHARGAHDLLDALADHVELPLERILVGAVARGADEDLPDLGQHGARERAGRLVVDRHAPPAEEHLAFLGDHLLEQRDARLRLLRLLGEEDHADAVGAGRRERDALGGALAAQKRIRHLDEDAGPVPGERVAAARAAMGQVLEDGEPLLDDVVRALALHVDHEADAARVALGPRIEEPAGLGIVHARLSPRAHGARRSAARACRAARAQARRDGGRAARARCASRGRSWSRSALRRRASGSG